MILALRTRLMLAAAVLAIAGVSAIVLLPKLERALHRVEQTANSPHGLAGGLAQQLLPRPRAHPSKDNAAPDGRGGRGDGASRTRGAGSRGAAGGVARRARGPAGRRGARSAAGDGTPWALVVGVLLAALALAPASASARFFHRRRRVYMPYPILPNGNDRPSPRQVVAALATMGESVSEPLSRRLWRGQPVFGVQLDYDPDRGGEVLPLLVCERRHLRPLSAALRQAYPNARIESKPPSVAAGRVVWGPRVLWRLRKSGDPIYPLYDALAEEDLGAPLESVATMLHGLGEGTRTRVPGEFASVRITVLPGNRTASYLRERHRRKERNGQIAGQISHGQHAPQSSVDAQQARQSVQLSEHALFHVEVQIASDEQATCKRLAGALLRYPGMNTLQRRNMIVREALYRRRWASFQPPVLMRGAGKVMSASELGYLLRLPAAGQTAPMRWLAEPRLEAAPSYRHHGERGTPLAAESPDEQEPQSSPEPRAPAASAAGRPSEAGAGDGGHTDLGNDDRRRPPARPIAIVEETE